MSVGHTSTSVSVCGTHLHTGQCLWGHTSTSVSVCGTLHTGQCLWTTVHLNTGQCPWTHLNSGQCLRHTVMLVNVYLNTCQRLWNLWSVSVGYTSTSISECEHTSTLDTPQHRSVFADRTPLRVCGHTSTMVSVCGHTLTPVCVCRYTCRRHIVLG